MSFDKAAYWREKNARKIAGKAAAPASISTRIVCRRCQGSAGQLVKSTFFCSKGCDQNSLWDRIVGFFGFGNWRVVYLDGLRSEPMSRSKANHQIKYFGGVLIRTTAPITTPMLRGKA